MKSRPEREPTYLCDPRASQKTNKYVQDLLAHKAELKKLAQQIEAEKRQLEKEKETLNPISPQKGDPGF